jgi:uncharacterized protein with HEPN domain
MSRDKQRLVDYLNHILLAIERITRYIEDMDELSFLQNQLIQDATIRNLEVIGEASHNVEVHFADFAASHPEIPFGFAYQMRNSIAHGYFKVDFEIVWRTIENDLPTLEAKIIHALKGTNYD